MSIETADNPPIETVTRALVVDLDGTLIAADATVESIVAYVKRRPVAALFRLPLWLAQGRAVLKRQVVRRIELDPAALPYRPEVLDYIRRQKDAGRPIVLATASDQKVADAVGAHLGLFDACLGSDASRHVKGEGKLAVIEKHLGHRDFDYIGDAHADLPLWRAAGRAIMVNPAPRTRIEAARTVGEIEVLVPSRNTLGGALRAMRPHQWIKNLLLAVPMIVGHQITWANLALVLLAIISFSLCASAIYILNDLFDLDADRRHPRKRYRPLAGGDLPLTTAMIVAAAALIVGLLLALAVSVPFVLTLLLYLVLTTAYSLWLKSKLLVDVIVLAGLYTLRIYAGGMAVGIEPSHWLLLFSMFLFLSLAFVKRFTELRMVERAAGDQVAGRGYLVGDIELLRVFGPVCGYLSVLVFAMYLNSDAVTKIYDDPRLLWLICPLLLYWVSRVWLVALRGKLHHDPVVYAATDRHSYIVAGLAALILLLAT